MYENMHRIIGFLGSDAEARTSKNDHQYAVLSVATKSSYKDRKTGEYVSQTEWHRCIVWGKLAEWAQTLKKGTHLQVTGESRSRQYADKKYKKVTRRIWEIQVRSILKLDRAEKVAKDDVVDSNEIAEDTPF